MPIPHRPRTIGHAIGSMCLVTVALIVDDAVIFISWNHGSLSVGVYIAAALIAIMVTIALFWLAYENWYGRLS